MKPRVYLETSVISYLVGRLNRDIVVLANHELTQSVPAVGHRAAGDLYTSGTGAMTNSWEDPIVHETRIAREKLFEQADQDLATLCRLLREREQSHDAAVVSLQPRRPELSGSEKL